MKSETTVEVKMPTVPANQVPTMTEKECIAAGLPPTSKSKARLGVSNDHEIVWPHPNFALEDHQNLLEFAKGRNMTAAALLSSVAMTWFEQNRDAIYAEADVTMAQAVTADDLVKKIAKMQRDLARTQEMLSKKTAETADEADMQAAADAMEAISKIVDNAKDTPAK